MSLLFRKVEVEGRLVDVRTSGGRITEVGTGLVPTGEEVVDGLGGALLPGLWDHHIHLMALASALESVDCGPLSVPNERSLAAALARAPGDGWIRATGYHESVAGILDRHALDRLVSHRPVRVQHRGGGLWVLNTRALELVAPVLDESPDVERAADGQPTGRLWRYDERLRPALPDDPPDLGEVARRLTSYGITGVTDATPGLDHRAIDLIAGAIAPVAEVTLLGAPTGELPNGLRHGPHKVLLRDHDLPTYPELGHLVSQLHTAGRPVAVHCVTRESLLLSLAVFSDVGTVAGDRIEHASIVPKGVAGDLADLGLTVVTQPSFLRLRGDDYLREVDPDDLSCLYPYASLLESGVRVAASSDAPYGDLDPWRTIRDAAERLTSRGVVIAPGERVQARMALAGYLSPAEDPGGPERRVVEGAPADLCLLSLPLDDALSSSAADNVRATVKGGILVSP